MYLLLTAQDLDVALKAVCEDLIANSALSIAAPIRSFLSRSTSYLASKPTSGTLDLTAQEWATPDQVKALHNAFIAEGGEGGMEGGMAEMLAKLNTWLSDKKAVAVLIPPIQVRCTHSTLIVLIFRTGGDLRNLPIILQLGQKRV